MSTQNEDKKITLVIGWLILILIAVGIFWVGRWFFIYFASIQKEVQASIIAAVATILVSVFSVMTGKYLEKKRSVEQDLRERKIPLYLHFFEFTMNYLLKDRLSNEHKPREEDLVKDLIQFTTNLMIWGSDEVILQWGRYRSSLPSPDQSTNPNGTNIFELEKLLMLIRKDLGHKNKNLAPGDLLELFVNDIDSYKGKH